MIFAALILPFAIGAVLSGTGTSALAVIGLAASYVLFWTLVCLFVLRVRLGSVANDASLAALWLVMTLILPGLALLAINSATPVRQGVELTLAQREAVHGGWKSGSSFDPART